MVAGDGQRVEAGTAVQVLPDVQVLDADGAPLSNILVTFLSDDGVVTGAEVLTDGQGRAAVGGWTAGTAKGQQELFAMVPGGEIKGSPAVFGVFAEAGPPVALLAAEGGRAEYRGKFGGQHISESQGGGCLRERSYRH